jgi:hypothetical protein
MEIKFVNDRCSPCKREKKIPRLKRGRISRLLIFCLLLVLSVQSIPSMRQNPSLLMVRFLENMLKNCVNQVR